MMPSAPKKLISIKKMRKQVADWEKILAKVVHYKELLFKIQKELLKLKN